MVSLPGESAISDRLVTAPYTTAAAAQTSATTTPWSVRKLDKENLSGSGQSERRRPDLAAAGGRAVYREGRRERLLPRNPEPAGALGRAGARLIRRRLLGRRLAAGALGVEHLQARERVLDRAELLAVARLDERQQGARALDRLPNLLEVGLRWRLALGGRWAGEPGLAGADVEQRDDG